MLSSHALLEVLAGRGIEDIDAFLKVPSWNDLPDPFSIPSMEQAATRVLRAIREKERITIFGDYDCDGVLGAHILRSLLGGFGTTVRTYLPHRDEGYGLSTPTVHNFSRGELIYLSRSITELTHGRPSIWRIGWGSMSS